MANSGMGRAETARALELAEGYLEDAEHVLWVASAQADPPERAADLEELTRELWRVEHAITGLRDEVHSERDAEPAPFDIEG